MNKRTVLAIFLLVCCGGIAAKVVEAQASAVPNRFGASFYLPGTKLTYLRHMGNKKWTCTWALVCGENTPVFHSTSATALHRVSGWAEYGLYRHGHTQAAYAAQVSTFADSGAASAAVTDMGKTLLAQDNSPVSGLAGMPIGGIAFSTPDGKDTIMLFAASSGTTDIEAGILVPTTWHKRMAIMEQQVMRQMQAVLPAAPPTPTPTPIPASTLEAVL